MAVCAGMNSEFESLQAFVCRALAFNQVVAFCVTLALGSTAVPADPAQADPAQADTVPAETVQAEDVVIVSASGDRRTRLVGEVAELTGKRLVFRHASGREEIIAGTRVIQVDSNWSPQLLKADTFFQQHDYRRALTAYLVALAAEQRGWVKQRIRARLVWCNRYLDRIGQAGATFRVLYDSDPTTRDFAAIPLTWTTGQPSPNTERRARQWLTDEDSAVARLMGASWLLSTSSRAEALQGLKGLVTDKDPRVVLLAEGQHWRTRLASTRVKDVERWTAVVDQMPVSIRAGPVFVLATALARHQDSGSAALGFMRIPILYPRQRRLSTRSLLAAAGELEKMNRIDEARGLYRELIVEYPNTDEAEQARQEFDRLK